jgi:hypothetical protein
MRLEEREHRLGGIQLLAAVRHGIEEDLVRAIFSLLPEDSVRERCEPLYLIGKVRPARARAMNALCAMEEDSPPGATIA